VLVPIIAVRAQGGGVRVRSGAGALGLGDTTNRKRPDPGGGVKPPVPTRRWAAA